MEIRHIGIGLEFLGTFVGVCVGWVGLCWWGGGVGVWGGVVGGGVLGGWGGGFWGGGGVCGGGYIKYRISRCRSRSYFRWGSFNGGRVVRKGLGRAFVEGRKRDFHNLGRCLCGINFAPPDALTLMR